MKSAFLKTDVRIQYVREPGYPELLFSHLHLVSPKPERELSRISQFVGIVQVRSPEDALSFVRLRTSPMIAPLLSNDPIIEVEVMPLDMLKSVSNYGLFDGPVPDYGREIKFGYDGVISRDGYRRGRFTPPEIVKVYHGYLVKRWTLSREINVRARKVCYVVNYIYESISTDGNYSRFVAFYGEPPRLPGTHWTIPPLE